MVRQAVLGDKRDAHQQRSPWNVQRSPRIVQRSPRIVQRSPWRAALALDRHHRA
jgi:hypothetical protein